MFLSTGSSDTTAFSHRMIHSHAACPDFHICLISAKRLACLFRTPSARTFGHLNCAEARPAQAHIPCTQWGHSVWARLIWPQPGHRLRLFTSFKALPAICRWRFFIWEVFFFGTARRTESQRSASRGGTVIVMGRARDWRKPRGRI